MRTCGFCFLIEIEWTFKNFVLPAKLLKKKLKNPVTNSIRWWGAKIPPQCSGIKIWVDVHIPFNLYFQRSSFVFHFFQAGCSPTTALLLPSPQDLTDTICYVSVTITKYLIIWEDICLGNCLPGAIGNPDLPQSEIKWLIFRSARASCSTSGEPVCTPVHPYAMKIWIQCIQAYMPHESSGDSSNQHDGPMGPPRRLL